ncbi:SLC13 family permease [Alkalimonas sp. MEB108]|uniref:SLC13 family permease n=1 Tax=Alkalimonas cellulosilytica TaxID=3058395 RepID=A0ABU7J541_9GAMM|nr:SLC13 family permease [Alkalimonas sp. MEB108]MEE2001502.1 SLC13 family permease [Alkalimonas sp. MEB108]
MSISAYGLLALMLLLVASLIRWPQRAVTAFGVALLLLLLSGLIDATTLLHSASNPGLASLVLLLLIAVALEKTSVLRRLSRWLITGSAKGSLARVLGFSAVSSSMLNNTAVVAAMLSTIQANTRQPASKLLLPMSYAAILGGTLTLIGTSTNLIVHSMLLDRGHAGFAFFDFTLIGLALVLACGLVLFVLAPWLPVLSQPKQSAPASLLEARVLPGSALAGKTVEQAGLRHLQDLFLLEIVRAQERICPVAPHDVLAAGDRLMFSGDVRQVQLLSQFDGLALYAERTGLSADAMTEVMVKQDAAIVGDTLKSADFRARFDAAVVAIRRDGVALQGRLGEVELKGGDVLLLATGPDFSRRHNLARNFFILSGLRPHSVLSGWREQLAWWGFAAMVVATAVLGVPLFTAAITLLAALLLTGCLSTAEIKRRFPTDIWLIVTAALCLASALSGTGLAHGISELAAQYLGQGSAWLAFAGVLLLTYLLTELITNNAAAALMFPVAYNLALGMGIEVMPMALAVAFAASASFITPYGYQTNLMVFNAGSYRLRHFVLTGLPVAATYLLVCLLLIPQLFPF